MSIVIYPERPVVSWPQDLDAMVATLQAAAGSMKIVTPKTEAEALRAAPDAEAWIGYLTPELLAAAPKLRWLQSPTISLESVLFPELVASDVQVTKMRNTSDAEVATHALMLLLALCSDLPTLFRRQVAHEWKREARNRSLNGKTIVLLGLGAIGIEFARQVTPLGAQVIGVDPKVTQLPPNVIELHAPEKLTSLIPRADVVVIIAPLTPQTMGLFDDAMFALMKPDAFFVNVGRGRIVKTDALEKVLKEHRIAGAGIDVSDPEPFPAGSPLWDMDNFIFTPHTAILGAPLAERAMVNMVDNIKAFVEGRPFEYVADKANWF